MSKWKKLAAGLFAVAAALAVATIATQSSASASDDNPTFVTTPFGHVSQARASNITATGLLNLGPLADAKCSQGQAKDNTSINLSIPGVVKVKGLEAQCAVSSSGNTAVARANIADIDILNGRIKIKAVESLCARSGGFATIGSTYGSLFTDQNYAKNGSGALIIPGIATVLVNFNANFTPFGVGTSLITIDLLNGTQRVVISSCSLTGSFISTD